MPKSDGATRLAVGGEANETGLPAFQLRIQPASDLETRGLEPDASPHGSFRARMLQARVSLGSFIRLVQVFRTSVDGPIVMKSILQVWLPFVVFSAALPALAAEETTANTASAAEELRKVDQVRIADGDLIAVAGGETFTPTNSVVMPFGIKVMTNLTYTVNAGRERKLLEGQILDKDGMLQSPDGSLMPVMDHVTQTGGRVMAFKDGVMTPVTGEMQLANGSRVLADGTFVRKSGERLRLMDGQLIKIEGASLSATDTAMLKDGRVVVQKDGSSIPIKLRPTQSMMMSDGTKVLGDGTVIGKDGRTSKLAEGEIFRIEGVRRRGW